MQLTPTLLALTCLACTASAGAQTPFAYHAPTVYVQAAPGNDSSYALTAGITLPWKNWSWALGGGAVRGHWDLWAGGWSGKHPDRDKRLSTAVIGAGPSLRWRGAQGSSPWFVEVGTSLTVSGKHFYSSDQRMATRWNFASHIGLGLNFGAHRQHSLSVHLQHASNASLKKPNPGANFLHLRYAHTF